MYLAGLTGGIASGKSTVAERLVHHGAELIDADEIARALLLPGTAAYRDVVGHFGEVILDDDGFIDRAALGDVVFDDPKQRAVLNEITHPPVVDEIANQLELLVAFDGVVVVDVPLLVEAGMHEGYDAVVVVAAAPETQVRRLVELRGATEGAARARVAAQAALEEKLAVATHVIRNEGTLDELRARADEVAEELVAQAKRKAAEEADSIPDD